MSDHQPYPRAKRVTYPLASVARHFGPQGQELVSACRAATDKVFAIVLFGGFAELGTARVESRPGEAWVHEQCLQLVG